LVADESKSSRGTKAAPNGVSRWKSILKTIAEQVSQVDSPFPKHPQDYSLFCLLA